jgi:hypothetical protein
MFKIIKNKKQYGGMLLYLIISICVFSILMLPLLDNIILRIKILRSAIRREQALQIAEAGVNYYQWRLAHFPTDYQDGTGGDGPYIHDYIDADTQEIIGQYSLLITPPVIGSTIVEIKSTGWTNANPDIKRTVTVKFGKPSLTKYAMLSHWHLWIYPSDSISGRFMTNSGVRFEGTGNAPIQSAKEVYTCKKSDGCTPDQQKPGIWAPEELMPSQSTLNFWQFPVQDVDFSSLTSTLSDMREIAGDEEIYLPPSNKQGYLLSFNSDGTVSIYRVNKRKSEQTGESWVYDVWKSESKSTSYDKTDFSTRRLLSGYDHYPLPASGIIFAEDNVWIEGIVNGRITVAAAKLGQTDLNKMPSIYIADNIVYNSKDGSDVLGLIAQKDIIYSLYSPTDIEINAAQVAQNGSVKVLYHSGKSCPAGSSCPSAYPQIKNSITTYGSIMSYDAWAWSYSNAEGSIFSGGYMNTQNNYDYNLLYAPPPHFPFSTSDYQQISWISD